MAAAEAHQGAPTVADTPSAQQAATLGLNLRKVEFKQEQWEHMPNLVYKACYTFQLNMNSLKKWADRVEDRLKDMASSHKKLEERVDAVALTLSAARNDTAKLSEELKDITSRLKTQCDTCATCLKQLLQTSSMFFSRFGAEYGINYDRQDEQTESSEEEEEEEVSNIFTRNESEMWKSGHEEHEREKHEYESYRVAKELSSLGNAIEGQARSIEETFKEWGRRREVEKDEQHRQGEKVEEVRQALGRARERLLSWRELLKESTRSSENMAIALFEVQSDVKQLKATHMVREDVDQVVGLAEDRMKDMHASTQQTVSESIERMGVHATTLDAQVRELMRETREHVEEHSGKISNLLERSLTPVNAYVNTLHVKADASRSDLNHVQEELPLLTSRVAEIAGDLMKYSGVSRERDDELQASITNLNGDTADMKSETKKRCDAIVGSIEEQGEHIHGELTYLKKAIEGTDQKLAEMRESHVSALRKDLTALEQKVAKWIHAKPLPAKLSEARLFALEARLAEETDARLLLEETLKVGFGSHPFFSTPRGSSTSFSLPTLAPAGKRSSQAGAYVGASASLPIADSSIPTPRQLSKAGSAVLN